MKLLVVGGQWPPETFIARRLQGLANEGYQVTLACNRGAAKPVAIEGVKWMPLPGSTEPATKRIVMTAWHLLRALFQAPRDFLKIRNIVARQPESSRRSDFFQLLPFAGLSPDILHFEWNFAAVQYQHLFDLLDCPVVISCRGSHINIARHNPERRGEVRQIPETFRRARAIHCVSEAIAREAIGMGADPAKIHIIRPAVEPSLFSPGKPKTQEGPFSIVMTGSVIWKKGYEYALESLRLLLDRGVDAKLTLIGKADKRDMQRLLYTIFDLELQPNVEIAGSLSPAQVVERLRVADAFLLASVSEGISNAVLEAMSCGIPVVTTNCPGMEEAVTNGIEGFVVGVRKPDEMADALERLAKDPGLRHRMGQAGRERIIAEFQLAQQTAAWVRLYEHITSAKTN